ncbi:single-stranded DNA-binding protein [Actinomyces marmotae]|uniref:Single-stranded DNA-binding protein n=1 Tax=Actinomyces marmotae TaxID=2737173 RepID=A0A6M8B9C3_9ACTO|nr:single-stranded DNA-binding protein [Actinomyces marmotae]QKD80011.1 single-stranded DNA-binding protein [Actinomyces marmotae]
MTHQLDLTIQGTLGTNPVLTFSGSDERRLAYCRFRVATTTRHRTRSGQWVDDPTMWFTAKCWGSLAINAAEALRKGDPVLLAGRMTQEAWDSGKGIIITNVLSLTAVGHDLNRGFTRFARVRRDENGNELSDGATTPTSPSSATTPGAASAGSADAAEPAAGAQAAAPGPAAPAPLPADHWEVPAERPGRSAGPAYVVVDDEAVQEEG